MNTKTKRVGTVASAVAAVGLVVGGAWGIGAAVAAIEPEPTSVVEPANLERPAADFEDVRPDVTPTPTPEPTETAPVVEPAPVDAPAEPEPYVEPEPEPYVEPAPAPAEPAPYVPIKCPEGTVPGMVEANGDESMCQTGDYTGGVEVP